MKKRLYLNFKAFTLIELLVVIAIIGLLSAIAAFTFGGARESARDAERINDLNNLKFAAELYSHDNLNAYYPAPTDWADFLNLLSSYTPAETILPPTNDSAYYYFYAWENDSSPTFYLGAILEDDDNPVLVTDNDDADLSAYSIIAVDGAGNDPGISSFSCADDGFAYCVFVQ